MMFRFLFMLGLLITVFPCEGQISIDSLLTGIRSAYTETGRKEYLQESFTRLESADKKDRYDLFFDSSGQLQEYIGLSVVHYSYDEQNRIILIEGFNSKGERSYWDFPVVTKYHYVNDTLVPEMNKIRNEICRCETSGLVSNVTIIRELNTAEYTAYNKTRIAVTSKDSTMKLSFTLCSDGKACNRNLKQVAYIFREFDSQNKEVIIQERRYNAQLKLVDGHYNVFTSENVAISSSSKAYAYSIRELKDGKISTIRYYNRKGKLVEISNHSPGPIVDGPVNSPVKGK